MISKRIAAVLSSLILVLSALPQGTVLAAEPQLHLAVSSTNSPRFLMTDSDAVPAAGATANLPEHYDMRSVGLVTAVKDQNPYGTCWSFGATASLESELIAQDPHIDLSEWYLAHRKGKGVTSPFDDLPALEDYLNDGGTMQEVIALLTNWIGPVNEADCPYFGDAPDFDKSLQEIRAEAAYHVTDFHYFNKPEMLMSEDLRNQVKQAIYDGHAISFSIGTSAFQDESIYNYDHHTYYMPDDFWDTFDFETMDTDDYVGHAMCIVGWDDSIPAEYFSQKPAHDGAWLVKNSWDVTFGDDGYFWLSYDDTFIDELIYYDLEDAECHDIMYAHDDFGCNGAFSISNSAVDTKAYGANVFTAEEDGFLTDVMVDCIVTDDDAQVTVYTNLQNASNPTSGSAMATASAQDMHLGYQTLPLSEPVPVKQGEKFSVVVQYTGAKGGHLPCELGYFFSSGSTQGKPLAQEMGVQLGVYLRFELLARNFNAGESFFSADGKTWNDTYKQGKLKTQFGDIARVGNLCIKALGVKAGKVQFSDYHDTLTYGTQLALSTPEQADLYYAVNGGSYERYTDPITFTEDMTISAYADTDEKTVTTRRYTQRHAELSSLLFCSGYDKWYLDFSKDMSVLSGEDEVYILPISTGTITIDGEKCTSGEHYQIQTEKEKTLTITVEEDGCLPTTYTLTVGNTRCVPIPNGIMSGYDPEISDSELIYEFQDGNGRIKRISDGKIIPFTYERDEDLDYIFHYADHDEKMAFSLSGNYKTADMQDAGMWFHPDGREDAIFVVYKADSVLEEYPCFTLEESLALISDYYEEKTGTHPDKVQLDEEYYCADVYVGDKVVQQFSFESNGTMWDPDFDESVVYGAVTGDTNADLKINASDAALILIEAAAIGAGNTTTLRLPLRRAADVNHDDSVNATDAAIVLRYAAEAGAGNRSVRLADLAG